MTSSRPPPGPSNPSPRDACQARIIETFAQIAADPEAGWSVTRSSPEISASIRSSRHMISRIPWTVPGSWSGWRSAIRGFRASRSLTLGLYFIVQVPSPTSTLRSAPSVSWESRS